MKNTVDNFLKALEDEIARAKNQLKLVPPFRKESREAWTNYIKNLEDKRVEAFLLMEFDDDED